MVTTLVDIDRGRLLGMVPGRSGAVVREWVQAQPLWWADQIRVATIDEFAGYASATRDTLPGAVLVVDHFHAIRLASEVVNDVGRRVQQTTTGHRGRKGDALYGMIRRLLLMTWRNLNDKGWDRLRAGLAAGDPDGEIAAVWLARELLSEVYAANAEVPELTRLARTIDLWRDEVLAYHSTGGASTGPTEAVNLVIEKIRRIGHGYSNYDNYRRRPLLGCGYQWTTVGQFQHTESEVANQRSPRRAGYRWTTPLGSGNLSVSDPVGTRPLAGLNSHQQGWTGRVRGILWYISLQRHGVVGRRPQRTRRR